MQRCSASILCTCLSSNLFLKCPSTVADLEIQKGGFSARPQIFGLPRPLSVTLEVQTEYLEATPGLVKSLEISKELIRVCVTCLVVVAACHSCILII